MTGAGLELKFKVEGPAHLVIEFYKYILINIESVAQNKSGHIDGVPLPGYKKTWIELSSQIERDIQRRALRDEVTINSDCEALVTAQ